jgi:uracil-DNA glycosylase
MANINKQPKTVVALGTIAEQVIDIVWHQPGDDQISTVVDAEDIIDNDEEHDVPFSEICICKQGLYNQIKYL